MLYRGVGNGFSRFLSEQGVIGFYRGVHIFFIKELICAFATVNIYEALKHNSFGLE
jgi:hypothetical protein